MQETEEIQVRSLGWEEPLEKEMATHFSILAWEKPDGLQSGVTKSQTGLSTHVVGVSSGF